jgi:L-2-hydroxyglutarate oxidase LhgO
LSALLIPSTAVVSFPAVAREFSRDITDAGGELRLGCRVVGIDSRDGRVVVTTDADEMTFDQVVVCAGLQSSMIAEIAGAPRDPEIIPFRGEYYELVPSRSELVRGLVYPVPDPRYPFLGVHFTRGVDGHVHVGPNAVLALSQEGYRWRDVDVKQLWRSVSYPGMLRLARHHWRMGTSEIAGSVSKSVFLRRARAYIPELAPTDIVRAESGVRAQALKPDGNLVDDFVIHHRPGITFVRNAPSPAATASLAIAEHIVDVMA